MEQEVAVDVVIRQRIRGLRLARGWSLDALAARCYLSPSTLSRIETGHRRIALDQLVPIARALDTTLDQLVESGDDGDVVIRPEPAHARGLTTWLLSSERTLHGVTVAKMRITAERPVEQLGVHPGREWFTVLSGTARLQLGERTVLVETGDAAEFSTMVPHAIGAHDGPVDILTILDHDGERAHLHTSDDNPQSYGRAGVGDLLLGDRPTGRGRTTSSADQLKGCDANRDRLPPGP
jgi:transcriptional regulator with XRE-family HTH domain